MDLFQQRVDDAWSVMLVMPDDDVRDAFSMLLRSLMYDVRSASTPARAVGMLHESLPRLIVLDPPRCTGVSWPFSGRQRREAVWSCVPIAVLGEAAASEPEDARIVRAFPVPVCLDAVLDFVRHCCGQPLRVHA